MLTDLSLLEFKSFRDVDLRLGPFTVVIGANAAGKSNIRDAFRFLHGLSRGYTLAETIGEKWIEGGVLQWEGVRGGTREIIRYDQQRFLAVATIRYEDQGRPRAAVYAIRIGFIGGMPRVTLESLDVLDFNRPLFDTDPEDRPVGGDSNHINAQVRQIKRGRDPVLSFLSDRPILTQIAARDDVQKVIRDTARTVIAELGSMRFLDLSPDAMRRPSPPGQTILSDRGENLASVLQSIYQDEATRGPLLEWIRELTPVDVQDLAFDLDSTGRVVMWLVEGGGHKTSVYSASDGTLRLLAMIAALLGPGAARFYFLEELEAGIHPARLYVLLDLIEQQTRRRKGPPIQIIASTHSPQLLRQLRPETLNDALLVYRPEGADASQVTRLMDVPGAKEALARDKDPGRLHESQWFENVLAFSGDGSSEEAALPEQ